MNRTLLTAVAITCLLPSLSLAQRSPASGVHAPSGAPRGGSREVTIRHDPPPPPRPSTSPGAPVVPVAPPSALDRLVPLTPPLDRRDVFRAGPRTYVPRSRNQFYGYGGSAYIADPFGYISQPDSSSPALDRYMRQGDAAGYLRLDVQPENAQVYIDGYYAGTVADFNRSGGRALDVGPHRLEIRGEGFDSQSVELQIRANDVLPYRGVLTRRDQRAELRTPPAAAKTFYVIPRCYAGTTRPRAEQLPAGCKVSDVRVVPPVVSPSGQQ